MIDWWRDKVGSNLVHHCCRRRFGRTLQICKHVKNPFDAVCETSGLGLIAVRVTFVPGSLVGDHVF
jgi:hypothetical protein